MSPTKKTKLKIFFSLPTRRLTKSFEGLNSTSLINWQVTELQSVEKIQDLQVNPTVIEDVNMACIRIFVAQDITQRCVKMKLCKKAVT